MLAIHGCNLENDFRKKLQFKPFGFIIKSVIHTEKRTYVCKGPSMKYGSSEEERQGKEMNDGGWGKGA